MKKIFAGLLIVLLIGALLIPCMVIVASPSEAETPARSAPETESAVRENSSEEPSETPKTTETTLIPVLTVPIGNEALVSFSANRMPSEEGIYSVGLGGDILADEDGTFYFLPYASSGKIVNLSGNRVLCDFSDYPAIPNEWIIDHAITGDEILFVLNTGNVLSCNTKTGDLIEYSEIKTLRDNEHWFMEPKLRYIGGNLFVEGSLTLNGEKFYYTPDGEKVTDIKPAPFPIHADNAVCTELANGNLLEKREKLRLAENKIYTQTDYNVYAPDGTLLSSFCSRECIDQSSLCPCHLDFEEFVAEKYYPHERTVGDKTFENTIYTKETTDCNGNFYEIVAYETRLELYRIQGV